MATTKIEMTHKVIQAFKRVPHPGRKIGDLEELRKWTKMKWQNVTAADINAAGELVFFSNNAVQYFMPAFLIAILEQPSKINCLTIIKQLGELNQKSTQRLCETFTNEQKQVIIEFLRFHEESYMQPSEEEMDDWTQARRQYTREYYTSYINQVRQTRKTWEQCLS